MLTDKEFLNLNIKERCISHLMDNDDALYSSAVSFDTLGSGGYYRIFTNDPITDLKELYLLRQSDAENGEYDGSSHPSPRDFVKNIPKWYEQVELKTGFKNFNYGNHTEYSVLIIKISDLKDLHLLNQKYKKSENLLVASSEQLMHCYITNLIDALFDSSGYAYDINIPKPKDLSDKEKDIFSLFDLYKSIPKNSMFYKSLNNQVPFVIGKKLSDDLYNSDENNNLTKFGDIIDFEISASSLLLGHRTHTSFEPSIQAELYNSFGLNKNIKLIPKGEEKSFILNALTGMGAPKKSIHVLKDDIGGNSKWDSFDDALKRFYDRFKLIEE